MGSFRRRTGITLFLVMATSAALVLPRLTPTMAEEAPAPISAVCDVVPEGAEATSDDCRRFVSLWLPRFDDKAWLQSWTDLADVPADIAAEGFHGLSPISQGWLITALVEPIIARSTPRPADDEIEKLTGLVALLIFGKAELNELRAEFAKPSSGEPIPDQPSVLQPVADALANTATAAETLLATPVPPPAPTLGSAQGVPSGVVHPALQSLQAPDAAPNMAAAPSGPAPNAVTPALDANGLISLIIGVLAIPPISNLLALVSTLLRAVASIQQRLFAVPGVSLIGSLTYRICAESATQPLACTVNLPVGVPIPTDVNGDRLPDVLGTLAPVVGLPQTQVVSVMPLVVQVVPTTDVGFSFEVARIFPNAGPLPAHVFAVYDPPAISKRVEYGYDARLSTLAAKARSTVTLKNVKAAVKGDVQVVADVTHQAPGNNEALTFALKQLVPQSGFLALPLERDPTVGAIRFTPVPTSLVANAHLQHFGGKNQDTISLDSDVNSVVTALLTQDVNTVSPASHREFSALIDELPNHVSVDVLNLNPTQTITYGASSVIDHIQVSQKSIDDTGQPGTFTQNDVDVLGLPEDVKLTLTGAEDIVYEASSVVPQVQFVTQTRLNGVLQKQMAATANGIPKNIHLNNLTAADSSTITYDADSSLASLALGLYDLPNDKTVLSALAQSFPTQMKLVQTKSTGATTYTADGPIGVIEATLSRNDGATIPLPAVDHATVKKVGTAIGLDLRLSGLAGAHIDPSEKASYGLQLSPGGQPFQAIAELDGPNRRADVLISNLPSSIQIDLDPTNGSATYAASAVIASVDARYEEIDIGRIAEVGLDQVPKNITATWATGGDEPQITYEADSRLGALSAFYQQAPASTSFFGQVSDLPLFMSVAGVDPIVFDARTSAGGASASDSVGQIILRYGSDGVLPVVVNPNDHLYLSDTTSTNAELVYSGLEFFTVDTTNDETHVQVKNSAPRFFDIDVITPNMTIDAFIDSIPDDVKVDMVDERITYTASSAINQIGAVVDRLNGDLISVLIDSLPQSIDVQFDSVASTIDWTANAPTGGISVAAQFGPTTTASTRTYNAGLSILNIPATWTASFAAGHILFDGISGPIGQITASFTNHGSVTTVGGNGLSAVFNEGTGNLDAYLRISLLDRAEFQKVAAVGTGAGGFDANFDMGNGGTFNLNANVLTADNTSLTALGSILNFPTQMHLRSVDGLLTYNGVGNPTLDVDVAYGKVPALAATPAAPQVHGLSLRDGISGGNKAVKASVFITGLPTGLNFNTVTGIYMVTNFDPTVDPLVLDIAVDNFVATPVTLLAQQVIGAGPVNFTFGPFTTATAGDGSKTIDANYSASRGMGSFTADATVGTSVAHLFVSNIPTSFNLATAFGADTKTINVSVGQLVEEITATYKGSGDLAFTAGATLEDIPAATTIPSVSLLIGKQGPAVGVQAPVFTYTASDAGLDLSAFLDDAVFGPASKAGFTLDVDNLGSTVSAGLAGTVLTLGSSPATQSFTLVAHAHLNFNIPLNFNIGPLVHTGNVLINLNVQELTLGFTNMSSLTVRLGYSTSVQGTYGTFTFGEKSQTVITVNSDVDFEALGEDVNVASATIGPVNLGNVIGNFRIADNHEAEWFSVDLPIPCLDGDLNPHLLDAVVELKPHPHYTTNTASFTVASAGAGGGAWIATVNPLGVVPDLVTDVIAAIVSPLGGSADFTTACQD